jgi:hypothetical protein
MLLGSFLVLARHALPTQAQNNMNAHRIKEAYKIGRLCTVLHTFRNRKSPLSQIHITFQPSIPYTLQLPSENAQTEPDCDENNFLI